MRLPVSPPGPPPSLREGARPGAVLRAEGAALTADGAAAIAANLREVAGAVVRIPRVAEAATQLDGAAGLIRAHGMAMPADLAGQLAGNIRAVADVVQGLGDAA